MGRFERESYQVALCPGICAGKLIVLAPPIAINGRRRKVLVMPSRFRDEGKRLSWDLPVIQPTSLETPLIQTTVTTHLSLLPVLDLIDAMEGVKDFYLRNSDGTFILDYVLTPTVTLDIPKYRKR